MPAENSQHQYKTPSDRLASALFEEKPPIDTDERGTATLQPKDPPDGTAETGRTQEIAGFNSFVTFPPLR